jgi:flagellar FliJ protein
MKKFKFNLAAVEKHRNRLQDEAQARLTQTITNLRATQAKILKVDSEEVGLKKTRESINEQSERWKANPHNFWLIDQRIKALKIMRNDLHEKLKDDEVQVRAAYIDFLEARKQKKIMEKLHEKKKSEFVEQVRKLEQKSNDELYTTRHQLEKVLQLLDGGMDSNE